MLTEAKAALVIVKFIIVSGLLGQFQLVDSVAIGKEKGDKDEDLNLIKLIQETISAREIGSII
jgi:hypothetical protein